MPTRKAEAEWSGDLKNGTGSIAVESGTLKSPYSFRSRMESGDGTNPEELIGAAHAGCFSMQLSAMLAAAGHAPKKVHTTAAVHFGPDGTGFSISGIDLVTEGDVPGMDAATFQKTAEEAKKICPVSKALSSVPITLKVNFLS